jgi:hypothetical protein
MTVNREQFAVPILEAPSSAQLKPPHFRFSLRWLFIGVFLICVGLVKHFSLFRLPPKPQLVPYISFTETYRGGKPSRRYEVCFVNARNERERQVDIYLDSAPYDSLDECMSVFRGKQPDRHYVVLRGKESEARAEPAAVPPTIYLERFSRLHDAFEILKRQYATHPNSAGDRLTRLKMSMEEAPLIMDGFRVTDPQGNLLK